MKTRNFSNAKMNRILKNEREETYLPVIQERVHNVIKPPNYTMKFITDYKEITVQYITLKFLRENVFKRFSQQQSSLVVARNKKNHN